MRKLSNLQVNLIRGDLRQSGVELRELEDDLLDHICCVLESEDEKLSFEEVYAYVKANFFPDGYRKVYNETVYLLNQKYKKMKKLMNALGIAGSAMLLLGSIMKMQSMLLSNELLMLGGIALIFGFLPIMLMLSLRQTDSLTGKFRNISGYIGSSAIIIGIVFKVLHYNSAEEILLLGIGFLMVLFLPLILITTGKETLLKMNPITTVVLILAILSSLFAFNNRQSSHTYRESIANISNQIVEIYNLKRERLESLRQTDTANDNLSVKSQAALSSIQQLKAALLSAHGLKTSGNKLEGNKKLLDMDITWNYIKEKYPESGIGVFEKINEFKTTLKNKHPQLKNYLTKGNSETEWLKNNFQDKPLYISYSFLSQLELEIAELEIEALNQK